MAGVLPGQGFRVGRLVRFGYAALTARADSMLFRAGERLPVHEFHHWDSTDNGRYIFGYCRTHSRCGDYSTFRRTG